MLKAEKLWKYVSTRRFVIGDFMWTGVDYLGECFWPHKHASAGVLDTCGFEKDGYYFYQSQWVKDRPVLHAFPDWNLDAEAGMVVPVVVYTNFFSAELFVNGRSWGRKAYEFPNQGMTKEWAHFDRPLCPITTNDLHLVWDVPYDPLAKLLIIGYNQEGQEIARQTLSGCLSPAALDARADRDSVPADGRSCVQIEIRLLDERGQLATRHDLPVSVQVSGGTLLGMDNGRPDDHTPYACGHRDTFHGLAYAVLRANRNAKEMRVTLSAAGLAEKQLLLHCIAKCAQEEYDNE